MIRYEGGKVLTLHPRLGQRPDLTICEGRIYADGAVERSVPLKGRLVIPALWDGLPAPASQVDYSCGRCGVLEARADDLRAPDARSAEVAAEALRKEPGDGRRRVVGLREAGQGVRRALGSLRPVVCLRPVSTVDDAGKRNPYADYLLLALKRSGVPLVFGSGDGAPPLHLVAEAVSRRRVSTDGELQDSPTPVRDEPLAVAEAIAALSATCAYARGVEEHEGRLAPGFSADFLVLENDVLELEPACIARTKIVMAVMRGEVVYER